MAASTDKPLDPKQEVDELRDRLGALSDHTSPSAPTVVDQAKGYAQQAQGYATQAQAAIDDRAAWLGQQTRQSPIIALLLACGAGYMLGRIVR